VNKPSRRELGRILVGLPFLRLFRSPTAAAAGAAAPPAPIPDADRYEAVVIGSGFGGTTAALTLAHAFKKRGKGERLLILERGAWWTTPVETVQDKQIATPGFLEVRHQQPVRYWVSSDHLRGLMDMFVRCFRRKGQLDGLYDLTRFGRFGLDMKGRVMNHNDGVTIARANGVGGGSLIYANVTIEPPDSTFSTWPLSLTADQRHQLYDRARSAIGNGVLRTLDPAKYLPAYAGLSNIVTRSARLQPHWRVVPDPDGRRKLKQLDPSQALLNALWIDRARVFQSTAAAVLADLQQPPDYGTVDSSISDLTPEGSPLYGDDWPKNYPPEPAKKPANFCERQGRCIIGCLPGARNTLNKQLMSAVFGKPDGTPPEIGEPTIGIKALAEVQGITPLKDGGYEVQYLQRPDKNGKPATFSVKANRVIVAAGCVGTVELLLKCKHKLKTMPDLSDRLGEGFSTNGDFLGFVEETSETVNLTRGPVTTSFAHFDRDDPSAFHTIEDNGVPRQFSVLFGQGNAVLHDLAQNGLTPAIVNRVVAGEIRNMLKQMGVILKALLKSGVDAETFRSEDIPSRRVMCVAAMGREQALGKFRLGDTGLGDTELRLERLDGKRFDEDPIYTRIAATLARFRQKLVPKSTALESAGAGFKSAFTAPVPPPTAKKKASEPTVLGVSHPLGGCRMSKSADDGAADEYGRLFKRTGGYYDGLYVSDAALIPTSLGVNPSLTISALSLRIADEIVAKHYS